MDHLPTNEYVGDGIRVLIRQLGSIPPEMRKRLVPKLRAAGQDILREASVNASWSTRIPRALRLVASTSKTRPGVFIRVNQAIAPHARAFEGISGRGDTFRHPVFGSGDRRGYWSQDTWVAQRTRPFLLPAVRVGRVAVIEAVNEAVDEAARQAGFR